MKKIIYLLFIILLFVPCIVNAEICDTDKITINSITIESKSDNVTELGEATASGKNINLNLSMSEVGDNIEYKAVVNNDSNEDYLLDKNSIKISSDYIDYTIKSEDNSNIVKAKSSKTIFLKVNYSKPVPEDAYENGVFNDNANMKVNLSTKEINNPKTGIKYTAFISFIVLLTLMIIVHRKNKITKALALIISLSIIIPISVNALCKCDISINSTIEIKKAMVCGSFESDSWDVISQNIKDGTDDCYHVGDTKEIDLGANGVHLVRIANKSTPEKCNEDGFSQTACGFVVEFADIISDYSMSLSWTNAGGWPATDMRTYVSNDIFNSLPIELKDKIIDTTVISGHSWVDSSNFTSTDKLYLLSFYEIYGNGELSERIYYSGTEYNNTRQLDYYASLNMVYTDLSLTYKKYNNSDHGWWTRSAYSSNSASFYGIPSCGYVDDGNSNCYCGVSPAFRIG